MEYTRDRGYYYPRLKEDEEEGSNEVVDEKRAMTSMNQITVSS